MSFVTEADPHPPPHNTNVGLEYMLEVSVLPALASKKVSVVGTVPGKLLCKRKKSGDESQQTWPGFKTRGVFLPEQLFPTHQAVTRVAISCIALLSDRIGRTWAHWVLPSLHDLEDRRKGRVPTPTYSWKRPG